MKRYVPTQPPGGVARTNTAESTGAQGHSHPNTQKSLLDTDSSDESGADSALSEDEDEAAKVVVQQSASSNSLKVRTVATKVQAIPIVLEGLSLLASYNEDNLIHFQGQQLMPGLIELVKVEDTREAALQFCARLIQRDTFLAGAVLKSLLDLSVCGKRGCSPAKRRRRSARQLLADCDMATHVLESISHLLISRASVRTLFRKNGGFAYIMTQLSDLAGYV
ncbi:hypothetical protein SARC_00862 [Sphaeroforma arctica JP610]|uniref:Uncharacterized protein n=1 Tax=Sphaeroforma arctica JP610 TaxID=667725 RepID=A0A0L0GDM0_9EUKA|nr:hypothetical protein SARC_00862 [Sphaeroforma arctica JP610]KNC87009.1 hypothetical protein SARC_00862 [Sphaeroforma arctica JP610]|eukprot:XP_014160911.1 hypothetical protein SARC_00862 [Sphaeroforma arctica JP610]